MWCQPAVRPSWRDCQSPGGICRQAVTAETGVRFFLQTEDTALRIRAEGVGAHAATPQQGNNALTGLLTLLARLPLAPSAQTRAVQALSHLFPHGDWQGQALGIAQADPVAGPLTISLNLLQVGPDSLFAMSDSRVPLCATEENCAQRFRSACMAAGLAAENVKQTPVHHVPADRPFIQALLKAYTDWTGQPGQCLSIGGGTYVHDLKNGVAFGCSMPGTDYHIHDADEFIPVDELVLSAEIFDTGNSDALSIKRDSGKKTSPSSDWSFFVLWMERSPYEYIKPQEYGRKVGFTWRSGDAIYRYKRTINRR